VKTRIERDPVGFASVLRLFLAACFAAAVLAGWNPDADRYTLMSASVVAFVEAGLTWWVKGLVTPDAKVVEKVEEAKYIGAVEHQAVAATAAAMAGPQQVEIAQPAGKPVPVVETPKTGRR
jgi:hypothetical protein